MKRIDFLAPVESMRGNLSGNQQLQYAENNNPAYEAPNGTQYARNYSTRYIGAKRSSTNLKYFAVRTKNAATLNSKTRVQMGLTAVSGAMYSALKSNATLWASVNAAFNYIKEHDLLPEGVKTLRKWIDNNVRRMVRYHITSWSFSQASISFDVYNPFEMDNSPVTQISQRVWTKFVDLFAYSSGAVGGIVFQIDGIKFFAPFKSGNAPSNWSEVKALDNPQLAAMFAQVSVTSTYVTYQSADVYTSAGATVAPTAIIAGDKYTTIAPTA